MKLDYFSLLSPLPYHINNVGSIKSPTLREISKIGYSTYQLLISNLLINIDSYYEMIDESNQNYLDNFTSKEKENILEAKINYEKVNGNSKKNTSIYHIITLDRVLIQVILNSLNFFFEDEISYDIKHKIFLLFDGSVDENNEKIITGFINEKNYDEIIDVILQRINISRNQDEYNNAKVKNKIAEKILKKIQKANKPTQKKEDKKMEIGNLISAISSHSKTLNILNIWDLTIFQLYDQFTRMKFDDLYLRVSTSVSVWGDTENKFDDTIWFSNIKKD